MNANLIEGFIPLAIMMGIAVILYLAANGLAILVSPSNPNKVKSSPYECGETPVGSAWSQFNVRFYVVGLIFIIFDVESVLMFPVAKVFRSFMQIGEGGYVLIVMLAFISILVEGIAYCWRKGDLDWVKSFKK